LSAVEGAGEINLAQPVAKAAALDGIGVKEFARREHNRGQAADSTDVGRADGVTCAGNGGGRRSRRLVTVGAFRFHGAGNARPSSWTSMRVRALDGGKPSWGSGILTGMGGAVSDSFPDRTVSHRCGRLHTAVSKELLGFTIGSLFLVSTYRDDGRVVEVGGLRVDDLWARPALH